MRGQISAASELRAPGSGVITNCTCLSRHLLGLGMTRYGSAIESVPFVVVLACDIYEISKRVGRHVRILSPSQEKI